MFRTYEPSVNALEGSRSIQNTGSFGSEICEIDQYKNGKKKFFYINPEILNRYYSEWLHTITSRVETSKKTNKHTVTEWMSK